MRHPGCLIVLAMMVATGCGSGSNSSTTAFQAPPPPPSAVSVYPSKAVTPVGTIQPFTATETGTFSPLKWTASAGTIDQSGNYTAPLSVPAGGKAKVIATTTAAPVVSGSAIVTITTQPVTLSIAPLTATVKAGFSQGYVATVGGTTNIATSWFVTDSPGDSTYPGFIISGVYTAPSPVLSPDTFVVSATSNADPTKTASASVSVIPLENQLEQAFPIKLGTSGVNATVSDCCSGTLGSLLVDQKGKQYILSNNHVLGRMGHAKPGDAVIQPGYVDTLCDRTLPKTVANFTYSPPVGTSNVDAAIAQVVAGAIDPHDEIIGLGGIASDGSYIPAPPANTIATPTVNMPVAKSGRTTGLSCSSVVAISARVCVDYSAGCGNPTTSTICYSGQVVTGGNLIQPGDSGSLILNANTSQPLALVVGGNGEFASANPVGDILNALKSGTGSTFSFVGAGQHRISCTPAGAVSAQELTGRSPAIADDEIAYAIAVQRRYESTIMRNSAVLAMGIGDSELSPGRPAVLIFIEKGRAPGQLPVALDGVPVRLIKTERFRANMPVPVHQISEAGAGSRPSFGRLTWDRQWRQNPFRSRLSGSSSFTLGRKLLGYLCDNDLLDFLLAFGSDHRQSGQAGQVVQYPQFDPRLINSGDCASR